MSILGIFLTLFSAVCYSLRYSSLKDLAKHSISKESINFYLRAISLPFILTIFFLSKESLFNFQPDFPFVKKFGQLSEIGQASGDILANISPLGGSISDDVFTEKLVSNFNAVADVTFEIENTNLINLAKRLKKKYSTGWDMFTFQGQIALENILGQPVSEELLKKHVRRGLSEVIK